MIPRSSALPLFGLPLLLLLSGLLGVSLLSAQDTATRQDLERVYRDWVGAMNTGSLVRWQQVTATHRQVRTYNIVASRRGRWPQSIFQLPFRLPETALLTHLGTLQKEDTAHLIYFGKVDFGLQGRSVPDNLILLRFNREKGVWKFDNTRFFNLANSPDVRRQAMLMDTTFLQDAQFQPTGEVPPTPRKIGPPEYVGDVWISSVGYETKVWIGDVHDTTVANDVVTALVIGGLTSRAKNVRIEAKEIELPPGATRRLIVEIYALRPGKKAAQVWRYEPEVGEPTLEHRSRVYANAVTFSRSE